MVVIFFRLNWNSLFVYCLLFVSDLVGNSESRVRLDAAHIMFVFSSILD